MSERAVGMLGLRGRSNRRLERIQ